MRDSGPKGIFLKPQLFFLNVSAFLPHETSDSESCHRNRTFLRPSQESDLICVFKNVRICVVCHTAVFSVVTQRSSGGTLRDDNKNGCARD